MQNNNAKKMMQDAFINQPEFLKDAMQEFLQETLVAQFEQFIGARDYERTSERRGYRNGTYTRILNTRVGAITLHVCRDREGEMKPPRFAALTEARRLRVAYR